MRFKINFSGTNKESSPHTQVMINSYINKCLGKNNPYHGAMNKYGSISSLYGGKINPKTNTINFTDGGFIVVSSNNLEFLDKLILGILKNPKMKNGMVFNGIYPIKENLLDGWNYFRTLTPFILIKKKEDKTSEHDNWWTLNDNDFEQRLKDHIIRKVKAIDPKLDTSNLIVVVPNHPSHKTKTIMVDNVKNVANQCQINIHCNKDVAELLYVNGIGKSTGTGFGTIYKTENIKLYQTK